MVDHADDAPAAPLPRLSLALSSPSTSIQNEASVSLSPNALEKATKPSQDSSNKQEQTSSAVEKILAVVERARLKYRSSLDKYFNSLAATQNESEAVETTGSPNALGGSQLQPANETVPGVSAAAAMKKPAQQAQDSPRLDRAGNLRPPNKRFLERDVTGELIERAAGREDQTQLEELQDWIKEKRYTKFDLIPSASEYAFDDMDSDFVTEPFGLKNQGRKLLVGKHESTEIWAVLPRHNSRIFMSRLIKLEKTNDTYTGIVNWQELHDSIPELYYPFEAFKHIGDATAWTQLQAVIGYIFLLCHEAAVAFMNSSKWPGTLSCAVTRIKEAYAPNDQFPTADTIDKIIKMQRSSVRSEEDAVPSADTPELTQLQTINNWLRDKRLLARMQAMVELPSVFKFKDYKPGTLVAKGIANVHDRALFLGEDENVEAWAAISRKPNKALLGWVVNVDKVTGEQKIAKYWPNLPTLTFPFEALKQKGDELSWRKLMYVVGYIFLTCGEAEVALNTGDSFFKHFLSVIKIVEKYYGTVSPSEDRPDAIKPCTSTRNSQKLLADDRGTDANLGSTKAGALLRLCTGRAPSETLCSTDNQTVASKVAFVDVGGSQPPAARDETGPGANTVREPLRQVHSPKATPLARSPLEGGISSSENSILTRTAPTKIDDTHGFMATTKGRVYRDLNDLHISIFIEETRNDKGKRPADGDRENRATKYQRLDAQRSEAAQLRVHQEGAVKRALQVYEEEKQKMQLLQDCEQSLAGQLEKLDALITDKEMAKLPHG